MGEDGQPPTVGIAHPEAPISQLPPEDAVLLNQVCDNISLAAAQPCNDRHQEESEGRDVEHWRSLA